MSLPVQSLIQLRKTGFTPQQIDQIEIEIDTQHMNPKHVETLIDLFTNAIDDIKEQNVDDAYQAGHDAGEAEAEASCDDEFDEDAYESGYSEGYSDGEHDEPYRF